ncbi:hypothetical protein H0H93_003459 [Arthromyces matolae]|nr:hypothetical protein H0H93_003459 [Arthromyces matolae]
MASAAPQDVEMLPPPTSDPALSLRELALKSIKSRRKVVHVEPVLPPRPPVMESPFQLDYGQEDGPLAQDPSKTPVISTPKPATLKPPSFVATQKPPPNTLKVSPSNPTSNLEIQVREEGEISEEEEVQVTLTPLKQPSPSSHVANSISSPRQPISTTTSPQISSSTPQLLPPLFGRISEPPAASDSSLVVPNDASSAMQVDSESILPASGPIHDPAHIRPGVAMNQEQYDQAKDIVLDLLGWGVDPEYLVDCGVTREVVYYVFTELNLRLPRNLDTTGLVPFTPEDALELRKAVLMPPPPPPVQTRRPSQEPSVASSSSIPPVYTPSPPPDASPARKVATPSRSMELPKTLSSSELHDMEQQRRQELMARKAAIASKKLKRTPSSVTSSPSSSTTVSASSNSKQDPDKKADSVDDFLKTIGSSSTSDTTSRDNNAALRQPLVDEMDVDEIPGLSGSKPYKATTTSALVISSAPSHSIIPRSPTESSNTPLSPNHPPPSSTESIATTFSSQSTETATSTSSSVPEPHLPEGPALQRRSFRRPVASDFVDFDPESRPPSHPSSRNGFRPPSGPLRRRGTGFASVSSQPRCIIDVSDSEGEGDGDIAMRDIEIPVRGYASPLPIKPFPQYLTTNGWETPPTTTSTPTLATPTGTMSPAALLAKENEIQRMREMIAEKERKLREAKALEASAKADVTMVKREEVAVPFTAPNQSHAIQSPQLSTRRTLPSSSLHSVWLTVVTLRSKTAINITRRCTVKAIPRRKSHIGTNISKRRIQDVNKASYLLPSLPPLSPPNDPLPPPANILLNPVLFFPPDKTGDRDTGDRANVNGTSNANGAVDVDLAPSTSTQDPITPEDSLSSPGFSAYDSPLSWYPLLASRSNLFRSLSNSSSFSSITTSFSSSAHNTSSSSSSSTSSLALSSSSSGGGFGTITLLPLKLATATKMLDPAKRLCQYEVPGPGVCRDEGCEDMHLSRIMGPDGHGGVDPSDPDTAEYLLSGLPRQWVTDNQVSYSRMVEALQEAREKDPQMGYEERVKIALYSIGLPP